MLWKCQELDMHLVNDSEKYFNENIEIQKICSISVDTLLLTLWD